MEPTRPTPAAPSEVERFYDEYVDQQVAIGVNERHRSIMEWLRKAGMHAGSRVLEIGCGVGTQTELIAQVVTTGTLLANDISPRSVQAARQRLKGHQNVDFVVGDIVALEVDGAFDLIVLPDVLEHIPLDHHGELFKKLASLLAPGGTIVVHIPSPQHIHWLQQHHPERLQVIDQQIHLAELAPKLSNAGLYLRFVEHYGLWLENSNDAAVLFIDRYDTDLPVKLKRPKRTMAGRFSRLVGGGATVQNPGTKQDAVLFIVDWWPLPGNPHNGVYVWEHAQALARHRKVVVVRVVVEKGSSPGVSFVESRDGEVVVCEAIIRTPVRRFGVHDALVRRYYRRIVEDLSARYAFRIAHVHVRTDSTACFPPVAASLGLPVVVTEHSSFYRIGINSGQLGDPAVLREGIRRWFAHKSIKRVLPVSHDLAHTLVSEYGVRQEQIAVVPNVASPLFRPMDLAAPAPFRIVLAARWSWLKDPLLFLDALHLLPPDVAASLEVDWIGDGEPMEKIKVHARALEGKVKVNFRGYQLKPEIAHFLGHAHLLVHPTKTENLPCIIIESLASGTPVLSHAVGGVPELIDHTNGILCAPGDVQAFADALTRIVRGEVTFDRTAIAAAAGARYSQDNVARAMIKVYDEVLAEKA
mgnify:CR=1 FL=1